MRKVYSYNWATGEYLGEESADPNPLEPGEYLIPAHSTEVAPPPPEEIPEGHRVVFDLKREEWFIEDIREQQEPQTFEQRFAAIPANNLVGDLTIGDLFNGQ